MRRFTAAASATRRSQALLALLLGTAVGLAGCGSIDDALFGSDTSATVQAGQPSDTEQPATAGTLPGAGAPEGTLPQAPAAAAQATAGITPVPIEPGSDTGTAVSHTIQSLRAQVAGIQDRML